MTKELTDDQIRPLIPQDMDWKYVVGEAGALEFAREVIKLDRANREKNYTMLTAYAKQYHAESAEEMYARHVDAEEADDETIRKMLAVTKPALYGKHLRGPNDGPITRATIEAEIAIAKQQFAIVAEAAHGVPDGQVLAPKEPTTEMILALMGTGLRHAEYRNKAASPSIEEMKQGYRAMLAAAPQPAAQPERKPMTLDQIDKLLDSVRMRWAKSPPVYDAAVMFVEAVEAFHGIKEQT